MKRGVPPTALKARTGEFTPPGMTAQALSNSFAEMAVPDTSTSVPAAGTGFTTGCSCRPSTSLRRQLRPRPGRNPAKVVRSSRLACNPPFLGFDDGDLGIDRRLLICAAVELGANELAHAGAPLDD
jgi:hypothetical protein